MTLSRLHINSICINHRRVVSTLLLSLTFSMPAWAQTFSQIDRLIFDPVLIEPVTGREMPAYSLPLQLLPMDEDDLNNHANTQEEDYLGALDILRNIDAYLKSITELETESGPFSPELIELLIDLGSQYQQAGDHAKAIEIFQRAEQISRVNNGLYHPDQYTSIEKMIDSYMAMGDVATANEKQRYLVYLTMQHHGDSSPEALPYVVNLADTGLAQFNKVMSMPKQPVFSFSSGTGFGPSRRAPTPREMAFGSLFMAQQNYQRAISTMLDNRQYFDPVLLDLEYRFLETLFLQAFRQAILNDPDYYLSERSTTTGSLLRKDYAGRFASYNFNSGKNTFERILIYIRNNPEARVYQLINALMEYGDWCMLFGKTQSALRKYREAYELVHEIGVEQASIEHLFRPTMPVHLPLITAKPNSREKFGIHDEAELEYEGYIDIAFTVSKYGKARSFETLGATENVTRQIERRLVRYLRNSPFRPRLESDNRFESQRVEVRYYFTYADNVI
jgi:tetratricopeptide (TPR) repeat protein